MERVNLFHWAVGITLLANSLLAKESVAPVGNPPWDTAGRYTHEPIRESSGLVTSYRHKGIYWTLNDSGNPPVLYATRLDGGLIREVEVKGAQNKDWEALAIDDDGHLWIGEIGNNSRQREDLRVYVVEEPDPFEDGTASVIAEYAYRYPSENVDAEGMFMYAGVPHIVSKEMERAVLYRFPALREGKQVTLEQVGELRDARLVTGAALTSDGKRLAVCTYDEVWIYQGDGTDLAQLISSDPWNLAHDFAVEANSFDGYNLVLTSESRNIYQLPRWWYQRQLALPPPNLQSALELLEETRVQNGNFRVEPYSEVGMEINGAHIVLEGTGPGAMLSQQLEFPSADHYDLALALTHGPRYGKVELLVDGKQVGDERDCYTSEAVAGVLVQFGSISLSQGKHLVALRISGASLDSANQVGLAGYRVGSAAPFVTQYRVLGPFAKPDNWNIDAPLPPEEDLQLGSSFVGAKGPITWRRIHTGPEGLVDFLGLYGAEPSMAVAYALTYVHSTEPRNAVLLVGSDDQVAIWLNREEVHRHNIARGAKPDQDVVSCRLKTGWNELLCKIGQNGGGWGLYLRMADPGDYFKYSPEPE